MRAFALEREHCIDHMFDNTRTCNLPVLGDMANQDDCGTSFLRKADQGLGASPHLRDRPRCGIDHPGPHRLD